MFKMSHRIVLKYTDSPLFHPSYQPDSFRIHLSQPLDLKGVWTVSLLEFSIDTDQTKQQGTLEIFVCSDICEDTTVEEREMPLLRSVYLDKQNVIYQKPYEEPIKLGQFQDVHVYIKDAKMHPSHFSLGK